MLNEKYDQSLLDWKNRQEATTKMTYKLITLFFRFLGLIPKQWGDAIGAWLGRLIYIADARHRKIAMQNMAYAFGNRPYQNRKLCLKVFENLGKILFEMARALHLNEKNFFRHFRIEGVSHIRDAYQKGKGVLTLTAHFGNWELLRVIAAMIGYPINIVYRPLDFKPMDRFITDYRTRFGGKLIPKRKSFRKILRCLNDGEIAVLLMDQNVSYEEGVFADFFGHSACTNKGLALLALKTEAPVIPVFLIREESGFKGLFLPQVPLIRTGDRTKDIEANTQAYNNVIEAMIRQYPEQWFWVHQRWKTKPYQAWKIEN